MAQWKRAGPITQRSVDWNYALLKPSFFLSCLRGHCHEIFDLYFFHKSNPSRPLINRLKFFSLKLCFMKIFDWNSKNSTPRRIPLRGVNFFCQASPLKSFKKDLGYVAIIHRYFLNFLVFSFKARRCLQRQPIEPQATPHMLKRCHFVTLSL